MIVEIWRDPRDGDSLTAACAETVCDMRRRGLISLDAVRLYRIRAASWEAAMADYHRLMDWEPYKPWETSNG